MKALIINTKKGTFKDKDGNIIAFTSSTIGRMAEQSENFTGYLIEEITGGVQDYDVIKNYVNKVVEVDIDYKKVDKKNYRAKLARVNEIIL